MSNLKPVVAMNCERANMPDACLLNREEINICRQEEEFNENISSAWAWRRLIKISRNHEIKSPHSQVTSGQTSV